MRIAFLSPTFPPAIGGVERFSEDLADWLAAAGHEVTVVTPSPAPPEADAHRPYEVVRGADMARTMRVLRRADAVQVKSLSIRAGLLTRAARRWTVVTHGGHQAVCPAQTAWGVGGACDAGPGRPGPCQFCPKAGPKGQAAMAVQRTAARLADVNVCVSRYLAGRLGVHDTVMIFNPLSRAALAIDASGPGDTNVVAFAGRFGPGKGGDVLLDAVATLPGVRVELAGDGPMRGAWEQRAVALGISDRVTFRGPLSKEGVAELYARAAVVCVPSLLEEAFGYAAAEAMGLGRAVVATPSGGVVELLDEGRGFLAAGRAPADVAAALSNALADDAARVEVGRRARAFALTELDVAVVGPRYVEQYRRGGGG